MSWLHASSLSLWELRAKSYILELQGNHRECNRKQKMKKVFHFIFQKVLAKMLACYKRGVEMGKTIEKDRERE